MYVLYGLKYVWYDGEEGEVYVGTNLPRPKFEKELKKILKSIKYNKKDTHLPDMFSELVNALEERGFVVAYPDNLHTYFLDDNLDGKGNIIYYIDRRDTEFKWEKL